MAAERPRDEDPAAASRYFEYVRDAHKWVAQVCLRHPSPQLQRKINLFLNEPAYYAEGLRDYIVHLAKAEEHLFALDRLNIEEPPDRHQSKERRDILFVIDDDYRRERFVQGRELGTKASFSCSPSKLTSEQRRLLMEALPRTEELLPGSFWLPMPTARGDGTMDRCGAHWHARLDPDHGNLEAILQAWESDYKRSLAELTGSSSETTAVDGTVKGEATESQ